MTIGYTIASQRQAQALTILLNKMRILQKNLEPHLENLIAFF